MLTTEDLIMVSRRDFLKYSVTVPAAQLVACGGGGGDGPPEVVEWPIAKDVFTTAEQQICLVGLASTTPPLNANELPYSKYGYNAWKAQGGLKHEKLQALAPAYSGAPNVARLLTYFSISDLHITDKESPAQPLYFGWSAPWGAPSSDGSAYSPVVLSTPHVLDAAIQTINVLHQKIPFDFGISLGDDADNTQYNELRWFIDVLDGKVITPSSGDHLGASSVDYQRPFKAAGLNKEIPWFQVVGNHDQFWKGSAYENAKTLAAHVSTSVMDMGAGANTPTGGINGTGFYVGVVDGSTSLGLVVKSGPDDKFQSAPQVAADPDRRSLVTSASCIANWMREFFATTTTPVGHGFTQSNLDRDFASYSFQPKSNIPIKVIVLDDTMKSADSTQFAMASLDKTRLEWLIAELQEGQDNDKLMIVAAHIPIYPQKTLDPTSGNFDLFSQPSVVTDAQLLTILHGFPNLMLWMSGHRHINVVTPQVYNPNDPTDQPERSFWEVETASLRDFPQHFRTFDIRRNGDNTISIIVTNVDPAVSPGSPAAQSRDYAVGAYRIFNATAQSITDSSSHAYNAELVIQLTARMRNIIAGFGSLI
jgi:metallophosphoesterase (TIGR03768 family)